MAWTHTHDTSTKHQKYSTGTEIVTVPDPGAAVEAAIKTSALDVDVSGVKFPVKISVNAGIAVNGGLDVRLLCSHDNSSWITVDSSLGLAVDTTGTNSGQALADATNVVAKYWCFEVFTSGVDTNATIGVTVEYGGLDVLHRI